MLSWCYFRSAGGGEDEVLAGPGSAFGLKKTRQHSWVGFKRRLSSHLENHTRMKPEPAFHTANSSC